MLRTHDMKLYTHKHDPRVRWGRGEHVVSIIDWHDTMLKLDNPTQNHMTIGGET